MLWTVELNVKLVVEKALFATKMQKPTENFGVNFFWVPSAPPSWCRALTNQRWSSGDQLRRALRLDEMPLVELDPAPEVPLDAMPMSLPMWPTSSVWRPTSMLPAAELDAAAIEDLGLVLGSPKERLKPAPLWTVLGVGRIKGADIASGCSLRKGKNAPVCRSLEPAKRFNWELVTELCSCSRCSGSFPC